MITRHEDYKYAAGGDFDKIRIDGGIMPLRPESEKRVLRGEDVCYMLEKICSLENAWKQRTGEWSGDKTNIYNVESFSFSKKLSNAKDDTYYRTNPSTISDVWEHVFRSVFPDDHWWSGKSDVFLMKSDQINTEIFQFGSGLGFNNIQPCVRRSDFTSSDPSIDKKLIQEEVSGLFDVLSKVKYVAIGLGLNDETFVHKEIGSPSPVFIGYNKRIIDGIVVDEGWSEQKLKNPTVVIGETRSYPLKIVAQYRGGYPEKSWFEDITGTTNVSTLQNGFSINSITTNKQDAIRLIEKSGQSTSGGCNDFVIREYVFAIFPVDPRFNY